MNAPVTGTPPDQNKQWWRRMGSARRESAGKIRVNSMKRSCIAATERCRPRHVGSIYNSFFICRSLCLHSLDSSTFFIATRIRGNTECTAVDSVSLNMSWITIMMNEALAKRKHLWSNHQRQEKRNKKKVTGRVSPQQIWSLGRATVGTGGNETPVS